MAREDKKKGYQGYKIAGDNDEYRKKAAKRAATNAQGMTSNAVFASQDTAFQEACAAVGIPATPRQASKFRNRYGKVARHLNASDRKDPEARRVSV